jgi:hypothetical protein
VRALSHTEAFPFLLLFMTALIDGNNVLKVGRVENIRNASDPAPSGYKM